VDTDYFDVEMLESNDDGMFLSVRLRNSTDAGVKSASAVTQLATIEIENGELSVHTSGN